MQILGTEGRIEIEIPLRRAARPPNPFSGRRRQRRLPARPVEVVTTDTVNQYTIACDLFAEAIRAGRPPVVPLEDALGNMRAINALFRSAQFGGWESV